MINPLECFFFFDDYVVIDRNPETQIQCPTLIIDSRRSINACPHRQFHILSGHLDSQAALSPSTLMPFHFFCRFNLVKANKIL